MSFSCILGKLSLVAVVTKLGVWGRQLSLVAVFTKLGGGVGEAIVTCCSGYETGVGGGRGDSVRPGYNKYSSACFGWLFLSCERGWVIYRYVLGW